MSTPLAQGRGARFTRGTTRRDPAPQPGADPRPRAPRRCADPCRAHPAAGGQPFDGRRARGATSSRLGLVEERVPSGGDRVGRPSYVVGPHPSGPFVVAVDVDVTHVTSAAVGIGGIVLARRSVSTGAAPAAPGEVADLVAAAVTSCAWPPAVPCSASASAFRAPSTGAPARWASPPTSSGATSRSATCIAERLGPAVAVSVGQRRRPVGARRAQPRHRPRVHRRSSTSSAASASGAGLVVNGAPLLGRDGRAGEIGHNVVVPNGPECHCGKRGCLETIIGDWPCFPRAVGRPPDRAGTRAVFADARAGDPTALAAVLTVAGWLGQALGNLVNTLNPQRVILGGSLSGVLELARPEIEQALEHYAFDPGHPVELLLPRFGVDSALVGAAELAFVELLEDPFVGRPVTARSFSAQRRRSAHADGHRLDAVDDRLARGSPAPRLGTARRGRGTGRRAPGTPSAAPSGPARRRRSGGSRGRTRGARRRSRGRVEPSSSGTDPGVAVGGRRGGTMHDVALARSAVPASSMSCLGEPGERDLDDARGSAAAPRPSGDALAGSAPAGGTASGCSSSTAVPSASMRALVSRPPVNTPSARPPRSKSLISSPCSRMIWPISPSPGSLRCRGALASRNSREPPIAPNVAGAAVGHVEPGGGERAGRSRAPRRAARAARRSPGTGPGTRRSARGRRRRPSARPARLVELLVDDPA